MNRDAVLEISKKENKGYDFVAIEALKKSCTAAWFAMMFIVSAVLFANILKYSRVDFGICFAITGSCAVYWGIRYKLLHNRYELFTAICFAVTSIIHLVGWILQLKYGFCIFN